MLEVVKARLRQGHRTSLYPQIEPTLPERFRGLPVLDQSKCPPGCQVCVEACPTDAITVDEFGLKLDLGRCLFCTDCIEACPEGAVTYEPEHRMAVRQRADLVLTGENLKLANALEDEARRLFGRSLKLRQVSAGGCNGCEAEDPEVHNGADTVVPVDLYVPGCPPHPWTILDGLLRLLGKLEKR